MDSKKADTTSEQKAIFFLGSNLKDHDFESFDEQNHIVETTSWKMTALMYILYAVIAGVMATISYIIFNK